MNDTNVMPIRSLDDESALAWLRDQPGGRTTAGPAELSRRWGISRHAVSRRIASWQKRGLVRRAQDGALIAAPPSDSGAHSTGLVAEPRAHDARASARPRGAAQVVEVAEEKPRHAPAQSSDGAVVVAQGARAVTAPPPPSARATVVLATQAPEPPAVATVQAFVTEAQSVRAGIDGMTILAVGGAGILACFSSVLCILGFATMFPGMPHLAMGMAAGLEFVRLIAIGFAGRCWHEVGLLLRPLLLLLIVAAESVSVVSVYSQLTAIHNGSRPVEAAKRELDRVGLQARVERQQAIVEDLDRRLAQIDRLTAELVGDAGKRGKINGAQDVLARQAKDRAAIEQERRRAADVLAGLKTDAAAITVKSVLADAEVAGVKQLAALVGGAIDSEAAARLWIAAITLLLGPFAAVLTAAAASRRGRPA